MKPTGAELEAALAALKQDSEENLFNLHARMIADAVLQTRDFEASNEFHRKCADSTQRKDVLDHLCLLLAAVSLTNSVIKIPHECMPLTIFNAIPLTNKSQVIAYLKYFNNFLNEIIGMTSFRDRSKTYLDILAQIYD